MTRLTRRVEQRFRFEEATGNALGSFSERRTLLVVAEDDAGNSGVGEASPLPGYSPDSLDDAFSALAALLGKPLGELGAGSSKSLLAVANTLSSPAARFGFDGAVLDLWSRQRAEPAWALLARMATETRSDPAAFEAPHPTNGLDVAHLLPSGCDGALDRAARAFARGIRCFKVKIGAPGAWAEELATLAALRRSFPDVGLRADANRALSPAELDERLPALRELALEWLEEPTRDFPNDLADSVGVPLAFDESLQKHAPNPGTARELGVRAYVLKPTTLGGFTRCLEHAERARSAGIPSVVSHAFEGPVGLTQAAALALALGKWRPPDGLDRHAGVADAGALPAFEPISGRIRAWSEPGLGLPLDTLLGRREILREARA